MNRPFKYKITKPSFEKIDEFKKLNEFSINKFQSTLDSSPIKLWFEEGVFKFEFDCIFNKPSDIMSDIEMLFNSGHINHQKSRFSFLKDSLLKVEINAESERIKGELTSFIENEKESFNNKYLRIVIPTVENSNIGAIEDLLDLKTDQEITYGSGYNSFEINKNIFEKCFVKSNNVNYLMIDSFDKIDIKDFDNSTDAILMTLGFIYGSNFGNHCFILSSTINDFSKIESILFFSRKKDLGHSNPIYNSHEIRNYNYSSEYFLFPKKAFNKFCEKLVNDSKFLRAINILFEANQNKYSLSKCILYASCIETLSGLIKEKDTPKPIDSVRFEKSDIINILTKQINDSKELNEKDKVFLIEKKIKYVNTPTNPDRLEHIFKKYDINLPLKFLKALAYRNFYLHGNIPKGKKLGSFDNDNYNRAFELLFLANVLALKIIGYNGFIKNYSAEMEYYSQKEDGVKDKDILIDHSLYYRI